MVSGSILKYESKSGISFEKVDADINSSDKKMISDFNYNLPCSLTKNNIFKNFYL